MVVVFTSSKAIHKVYKIAPSLPPPAFTLFTHMSLLSAYSVVKKIVLAVFLIRGSSTGLSEKTISSHSSNCQEKRKWDKSNSSAQEASQYAVYSCNPTFLLILIIMSDTVWVLTMGHSLSYAVCSMQCIMLSSQRSHEIIIIIDSNLLIKVNEAQKSWGLTNVHIARKK